MPSSVSVVVLNWNGREHLERCLPSLANQTFSDLEIIVVDNGSNDGSVGWVRTSFPQVNLIENAVNLGFAEACNQAIDIATGEYIATLNNDAWAQSDWLAQLVSVLESDPALGMCASKMLFADSPHLINSTGINLDWAGIAWDRRGGRKDDEHEGDLVEVFGPCAGAALYRGSMLKRLGAFDQDFFAYLEDVDLAWRAQLRGWRCLYVPQAIVYHHHSATAVEGSSLKNYLLGRNKVWLIAKNYPMPYLARYLPIIVLYDMCASIYALMKRSDWSAVRGRLTALRHIDTVWLKRQRIQADIRSMDWIGLMRPLAPPWEVLRRYSHLGSDRRSS